MIFNKGYDISYVTKGPLARCNNYNIKSDINSDKASISNSTDKNPKILIIMLLLLVNTNYLVVYLLFLF